MSSITVPGAEIGVESTATWPKSVTLRFAKKFRKICRSGLPASCGCHNLHYFVPWDFPS